MVGCALGQTAATAPGTEVEKALHVAQQAIVHLIQNAQPQPGPPVAQVQQAASSQSTVRFCSYGKAPITGVSPRTASASGPGQAGPSTSPAPSRGPPSLAGSRPGTPRTVLDSPRFGTPQAGTPVPSGPGSRHTTPPGTRVIAGKSVAHADRSKAGPGPAEKSQSLVLEHLLHRKQTRHWFALRRTSWRPWTCRVPCMERSAHNQGGCMCLAQTA